MRNRTAVLYLLQIATFAKAIITYSFYQHLVEYGNALPRIVSGYGWSRLVDSMRLGEYGWLVQTGLSETYKVTSRTLRPPVYTSFLLFITLLGAFAGPIGILLQSIIRSAVTPPRPQDCFAGKRATTACDILSSFPFPISDELPQVRNYR